MSGTTSHDMPIENPGLLDISRSDCHALLALSHIGALAEFDRSVATALDGSRVLFVGMKSHPLAKAFSRTSATLKFTTTKSLDQSDKPLHEFDAVVITRSDPNSEVAAQQIMRVAERVRKSAFLLLRLPAISPYPVCASLAALQALHFLDYKEGELLCIGGGVEGKLGEIDWHRVAAVSAAAFDERQQKITVALRSWQRAKSQVSATSEVQLVEAAASRAVSQESKLQKALDAALDRNWRLETTLNSVYQTDSYRIGAAFVQASQSWQGFLKLPLALYAVLRDGRRRRASKKLGIRKHWEDGLASLATIDPIKLKPDWLAKVQAALANHDNAQVHHLIGKLSRSRGMQQAVNYLLVGKVFRAQGLHEEEFQLSRLAREISEDEPVLRGCFWAAIFSNKVSAAYRVAQDLYARYEGDAAVRRTPFYRNIQRHPVNVLGLFNDVPVVEQSLASVSPVPNRVVYFAHNALPLSTGGYAVRTHEIARALTREGFDVHVVTRPGYPRDMVSHGNIPAPDKAVQIDGVHYHQIPKPLRKSAKYRAGLQTAEYLQRATDAIIDKLLELAPSTVVAASNYVTALPAYRAAKALGLTYFYDIRGFWEITKASKDPAHAQTFDYALDREIESTLAKSADRVYALSERLKHELVNRGVAEENVGLLLSAGNPETFASGGVDPSMKLRLGIPVDRLVIGYVGTFASYEGLEDLVVACARLKSLGHEFRLLLVGGSNTMASDADPAIAELRRSAEAHGIADWLVTPGRLPYVDVPRIYTAIDVCAFPRRSQPVTELISPIKPIEAMLAGKPLIAADVGGLTDLVQPDVNGVLFESGNVDDLAGKLAGYLTDEQARRTLGENARRWVLDNRTWNTTVKEFAADIGQIRRQTMRAKLASDGSFLQALNPSALRARHRPLSTELAIFRELFDAARHQGKQNPILPTSKRRSVYFLHSSLPHLSGGYATRAHGLITGITQSDWDIRPYTRPGFPKDIKSANRLLTFPAVDVIQGVNYRRIFNGEDRMRASELAYMLSMADEFYQVLVQERPTLVHGRSTYLTALPAMLAATRAGLPFVYEVSGLWELVHQSRDTSGEKTDLIERIRELENFTFSKAQALITLTDDMMTELTGRGVPDGHITLIPNCVDPEKFVPCERDQALASAIGISPGTPVIGYIGSFVDYEGLDDLLSASRILLQQGLDFKVLLVGDGNGNHEELAKELGDSVILTGRVPHEDIARYYSILDVIVYARKPWEVCETVSPMKPFEALAQEKAVIASSVRALANIIHDGSTGLIFQKGSIEDLAEKIRTYVNNPDLRREHGRKGRQWVIDNRSWRSAGADAVRVYGQALERHEAPAAADAQALRANGHTGKPAGAHELVGIELDGQAAPAARSQVRHAHEANVSPVPQLEG
ncbi:glycosyltransferase [Bordetella genomosp. 7]|nr:glycosyltransferase [Bordetella genomosp. 7]